MKSHIATVLVVSLVLLAGCTQPPKSPPANAEADFPRTYTVKPGDTDFWSISKRYYGDGKGSGLSADANTSNDGRGLMVGDKLLILPPPKAEPRAK